jgi:DnaJ-class molecular chaperone
MPRPSGGKVKQQPCLPCTGTGYNACTVCGGAGATFLSKSRLTFDGKLEFYQERVACTMCFGTGRVTCLSCQGAGWILTKKSG